MEHWVVQWYKHSERIMLEKFAIVLIFKVVMRVQCSIIIRNIILCYLLIISVCEPYKPWQHASNYGNNKENSGIYWIHTPKSGSSFGLAVLQICDPSTFKIIRSRPTNPKYDSLTSDHFSGFCLDWLNKLVIDQAPKHFVDLCRNIQTSIGHYKFPLNLNEKKAVIMIRSPKSRIISSFLDYPTHHEGMDSKSWDQLSKQLSMASVNQPHDVNHRTKFRKPWHSSITTAEIYMNHSGMKGCVTKTLNGIDCYHVYQLSMSLAHTAAARLQQFKFVGILEDWTETLLDFMWFNSVPLAGEPLDEMLTSIHRSGDHLLASEIKDKVHFHDPYDEFLYAKAKEIALSNRALRLEGKEKGRDASSCLPH